jgi:hypothetical protein
VPTSVRASFTSWRCGLKDCVSERTWESDVEPRCVTYGLVHLTSVGWTAPATSASHSAGGWAATPSALLLYLLVMMVARQMVSSDRSLATEGTAPHCTTRLVSSCCSRLGCAERQPPGGSWLLYCHLEPPAGPWSDSVAGDTVESSSAQVSWVQGLQAANAACSALPLIDLGGCGRVGKLAEADLVAASPEAGCLQADVSGICSRSRRIEGRGGCMVSSLRLRSTRLAALAGTTSALTSCAWRHTIDNGQGQAPQLQ